MFTSYYIVKARGCWARLRMAYRYLSTAIASAIGTMAGLNKICHSSDLSQTVLTENTWETDGCFQIKDVEICSYLCDIECLIHVSIRKKDQPESDKKKKNK